jgi:hypothetical protein
MAQYNIPIPYENLPEIILAVFAADNRTASAALRVGVLNGMTLLAGTVDLLSKRDATEERAIHVSGVRGVVNRIETPRAPSSSRAINLDLKH